MSPDEGVVTESLGHFSFLQYKLPTTAAEVLPHLVVLSFIKEELHLVKLCARWIPRLLTPTMRGSSQDVRRKTLQWVREIGGWDIFREQLVTGDETWIPFFDPPTKQESMVSKSFMNIRAIF